MRIAFIGGGNMARAIIAGVRARLGQDVEVLVCDHHAEKCEKLAHDYGAKVFADVGDWLRQADLVVLAVKPQGMKTTCEAAASLIPASATVLSIAAGLTAATIGNWLQRDPVVRAMPNTPAMVGAGFTGLYAPKQASAEARREVETLMSCVGKTAWLNKEDEIDVVIGGPGSGPAYVFLFLQCLASALEEHGAPKATAREMALCTVEGAAKLARETGEDFAVLRSNVTSKGGTTAAAIKVFEDRQLEAIVHEAVNACIARSQEMAKLFK